MIHVRPGTDKSTSHATCAICSRHVALQHATIACAYSSGQPAMACETHRADKIAWVSFWMTFGQQQKLQALELSKGASGVSKFYVEIRESKPQTEFKLDIGWHLLTRSLAGRSVIVADRPIEFLSTLRKQWKKMSKRLQIERSMTLDTPKRSGLDDALLRVFSLTFTAATKRPYADVLLITPDNIDSLPINIMTVYLCCANSDVQMSAVLEVLGNNAVIVDYRHDMGE
ncbi:MAG TPA: hypothetical protein VFT87_03575 [Candidatus Saccharimonadales bacterium]|nr:hypothetical protein [Candidatus Saccharimonadales bacterium]